MSTSKKPSLNDNPVVILLSAIASIIAIFIFVTGVTDLPSVLNPKRIEPQSESVSDSPAEKPAEIMSDSTSSSMSENAGDEAKFFYSLCKQYFLEENFERAIAECERALVLDPQYTPAYLLIASAYDTLGDHQAAEANLNKAEAQNNVDPGVQAEVDAVQKVISENIRRSFRIMG